jgi:F-type H+-transporting ATPase subunit epsilon
MAQTIFTEVVTPEGQVFAGEALAVTVPGTQGQFQVLPRHVALISSLQAGEVKIKLPSGSSQSFQIDSGVVEVLGSKVVVLAEKVLQ